jgi:peptidoglycan/LPS O-acetylase OafA/YrhL
VSQGRRSTTTSRIYELDGLRCAAILGVIAVHYRPPETGFLYQALSMGWAGVDLFFAISGFLITSILLGMRRTAHPFRTFYARRSARIFPPYYLVLSLICIVALAQHLFIPRWLSIGGFFFAPSLALQPLLDAFHTVFATHSLNHATSHIDLHQLHAVTEGLFIIWSLSVEEVFYLVWAPIVLRGSRTLIVCCAVLPILLCPALRVLAHTPQFPENTSFLFRVDSLSAGACVALLLQATRIKPLQRHRLSLVLKIGLLLSALGLGLIVWRSGALHGTEMRSTLLFAATGYSALGLFSSSLVGLCALDAGSASIFLRILRLRPAVYVGSVSYMIYLIHIPVYVAARSALLRFGSHADSALLVSWVALALTIALAALSWRYFERPILRWKDRRFR